MSKITFKIEVAPSIFQLKGEVSYINTLIATER